MEKTENRVTVKIFVGFELTVAISIHLNQSHAWKEASIVKNKSTETLTKIHYQDKDYIGYFVNYPMLTIKNLKERAEIVRESFQNYCPKFNADSLIIRVFPQVFVA